MGGSLTEELREVLFSGHFVAGGCLCVEIDSGTNAGAGFEGNADFAHGQFNTAKGLKHHGLIEPAEVTDSEHLAVQDAEARTKRNLIVMIGCLDHGIGILTFIHLDGGHGIGVPLGLLGAVVQAPCRHGTANTFSQAIVAMRNIIKAFIQQHIHRGTQATQERY